MSEESTPTESSPAFDPLATTTITIQPPSQLYWLVAVPELGDATLTAHESFERLTAYLAGIRDGLSQLFMFVGTQIPTSADGAKHALLPTGWVPLSSQPPIELEIDAAGWTTPPPADAVTDDDDVDAPDDDAEDDEEDEDLPSL